MKLLRILTPPLKTAVILLATMVAVTAQAAVSARQYVQRGLVAHWDALENNGYGQYDGAATVWKDLNGSYDLSIVNAEATWEADALLPPQKGHGAIAQTGAGTFSLAKYRAMEVCADYRSETATVAGYGGRAFSWHKAGFIGRDAWDTCVASLTEGTAYSSMFPTMPTARTSSSTGWTACRSWRTVPFRNRC